MAFVYKLDALMRCYETDLIPLREEMTRLNSEMQQLEQQMQEITLEIQSVEAHMAINWQQPELRRMGGLFVREQQDVHHGIKEEHLAKEVLSQSVKEEMVTVRTKIRQLEKHRLRLEQEYAQHQQKQQFHESDDMWTRFTRAKEKEYDC